MGNFGRGAARRPQHAGHARRLHLAAEADFVHVPVPDIDRSNQLIYRRHSLLLLGQCLKQPGRLGVSPVALGLRDITAVAEEHIGQRTIIAECPARCFPFRLHEEAGAGPARDLHPRVVGRLQNRHQAAAVRGMEDAEPRHAQAMPAVSGQSDWGNGSVVHGVQNALVHRHDQPCLGRRNERGRKRNGLRHRPGSGQTHCDLGLGTAEGDDRRQRQIIDGVPDAQQVAA